MAQGPCIIFSSSTIFHLANLFKSCLIRTLLELRCGT
uniref:Uncharacterized protein n=1 Tax=Rhizophora mucronata TaxID=61149 RepID=A0A2P2R564_RHIMU